jgi:hypothetical protein
MSEEGLSYILQTIVMLLGKDFALDPFQISFFVKNPYFFYQCKVRPFLVS